MDSATAVKPATGRLTERSESPEIIHRVLSGSELERAVENAAIAGLRFRGSGNGYEADQAATDAMASFLEHIGFNIRILIGEGKKDDSYGLFAGNVIGPGNGGLQLLASVDPIDGTTALVEGRDSSISAMAIAVPEEGEGESLINVLGHGLLTHYAWKLVFGRDINAAYTADRLSYPDQPAKWRIGLHRSAAENAIAAAEILGVELRNLQVVMLERDCNTPAVRQMRELGVPVRLIPHGDLAPAVATCLPDSAGCARVDLLMGRGGSPETVLAAMAVKCLGGGVEASCWPCEKDSRELIQNLETDGYLRHVYTTDELAPWRRLVFAMCGIISSDILPGIQWDRRAGEIITTSFCCRSITGTYGFNRRHHRLGQKFIDTHLGVEVINQ